MGRRRGLGASLEGPDVDRDRDSRLRHLQICALTAVFAGWGRTLPPTSVIARSSMRSGSERAPALELLDDPGEELLIGAGTDLLTWWPDPLIPLASVAI